MSRTKRGEKGPGYDYWSRRPYSSNYGYGPDIKRLCHRAERIQSQEIINTQIEEILEMDYGARYVTLRAKPNTWFDVGTEVFHYDYNPNEKIRITEKEYEEWKSIGSILCRGLRSGKWDGEYCRIDEFVVNSMICPLCQLNVEDCTCHDIEP